MSKKEIDILDHAREIKKYCSGRGCSKCKFYKNYGINMCTLEGLNPLTWKIPEKEILDDVEKEYLWNIIKPFKNKVEYVEKRNCSADKEYISIILVENEVNICLPNFLKKSMYKGMELDRKYTVEKLFGGK